MRPRTSRVCCVCVCDALPSAPFGWYDARLASAVEGPERASLPPPSTVHLPPSFHRSSPFHISAHAAIPSRRADVFSAAHSFQNHNIHLPPRSISISLTPSLRPPAALHYSTLRACICHPPSRIAKSIPGPDRSVAQAPRPPSRTVWLSTTSHQPPRRWRWRAAVDPEPVQVLVLLYPPVQ